MSGLKRLVAGVKNFFTKKKGPEVYCRRDDAGDYYAYVNEQGGEKQVGGPYSSCEVCKANTGATECM